jgi:hypothetical protein
MRVGTREKISLGIFEEHATRERRDASSDPDWVLGTQQSALKVGGAVTPTN